MFYDPRGQVVRTVNPDGSEQRRRPRRPGRPRPTRTAFTPDAVGDPTPTTPTTTPAAPTPTASQAYADHWNTPASTEVDALGRTVTARRPQRRRRRRLVHHPVRPTTSRATSSRSPTPLGRSAFTLPLRPGQAPLADGQHRRRPPRHACPTRSASRSRAATARARSRLASFDLLHRPSRVWARDDGAGRSTLRQRIEYGDAGDADQPPARAGRRPGARTCSAAPPRSYDEAGLLDRRGGRLQGQRAADRPAG